MLPKAEEEGSFQVGGTMDGRAGNTGIPTPSESKGDTSLPAYFTTQIAIQTEMGRITGSRSAH